MIIWLGYCKENSVPDQIIIQVLYHTKSGAPTSVAASDGCHGKSKTSALDPLPLTWSCDIVLHVFECTEFGFQFLKDIHLWKMLWDIRSVNWFELWSFMSVSHHTIAERTITLYSAVTSLCLQFSLDLPVMGLIFVIVFAPGGAAVFPLA